LAKRLLAETCQKQQIAPDQLTLHADRGASMRSKSAALRLADLGVTKTHSLPHDSDDNPFSESHFKTLKYRPEFPDRFGSIQDASAFCQLSFPGTTPSTITAASACSRPRSFTTAGPTRSSANARLF
jgi:putative transposase